MIEVTDRDTWEPERFHSVGSGQSWKQTYEGILVRSEASERRTKGEPSTLRRIIDDFGDEIADACQMVSVPVQLGSDAQNAAANAAADHVPVHRNALGPVAQVPRFVMEDAGELECVRASGHRSNEYVIALVRIEFPKFASEDHLVVRHERQTASAIVDDVEVAAEVRVPHEALLFADEMLQAEAEVDPGQKLDAGRLGVGLGSRGRLRI